MSSIPATIFRQYDVRGIVGRDLSADGLQAGNDLVTLVVSQNANLGQHVGVGDGATDVVGI